MSDTSTQRIEQYLRQHYPHLPVMYRAYCNRRQEPIQYGKQRVFVYGTLLDQTTRDECLGRRVRGKQATLSNHERIKRGEYPDVKSKKGKSVQGIVLELRDRDLKKLDSWEDHYQRKKAKLADGTEVWVYVCDRKHAKGRGRVKKYGKDKATTTEISPTTLARPAPKAPATPKVPGPDIHTLQPHERNIFHEYLPSHVREGLTVAASQNQIPKAFAQAHANYLHGLPPHQQEFVRQYTGGKAYPLNQNLRHDPYRVPAAHHALFHNLRHVVANAPQTQSPTTVWRAISMHPDKAAQLMKHLERAKQQNKLLKMNGFVSASLNPDIIHHGDTVFEIAARHGAYVPTHARYLENPHEHEYLMDHGSVFRIGDTHDAPFLINRDARGRMVLPQQKRVRVIRLEQVPGIHHEIEQQQRRNKMRNPIELLRKLLGGNKNFDTPNEYVKYSEEGQPEPQGHSRFVSDGSELELVDAPTNLGQAGHKPDETA